MLNDNLNDELNLYNEKIGNVLKQIDILKEAEKKAKRKNKLFMYKSKNDD